MHVTQFPEILMHHNVPEMAIFTGYSEEMLRFQLRDVSATRDMLVVKSCGTIIRFEKKTADHIRWLAKRRALSLSDMVRVFMRGS